MRCVENSREFIEKMELWDGTDYIPFKLWESHYREDIGEYVISQDKYIQYLIDYDRVCLLKRRQAGGSQLTAAFLLTQCIAIPHWDCLILSKSSEDAKEFLKRAKDMYNRLPKAIKQFVRLKNPDNQERMIFEHIDDNNKVIGESRMISLPANKGEGFTVDCVFVDEAGRINPTNSHITLEQVLRNVASAVEKRAGKVILCSIGDEGGEFHRIYQQGKDNVNSDEIDPSLWVSIFFSCYADPNYTQEDRDAYVSNFGEDAAKKMYPRTDIEAFISSSNCRFNTELLYEKREKAKPGKRYRMVKEGEKEAQIYADNSGWLSIWKNPVKGHLYHIAVDPCRGVEGGDSASAFVRDVDTDKVVAEFHANIEGDVLAQELAKLGWIYNNAFIAGENNIETTLSHLVKIYDTKLIVQQDSFDEHTKTNKTVYGWKTTFKSKIEMIDELDRVIRTGEVEIPSLEALDELSTYIRESNGKTNAKSGCHDDRVVALAILFMMRKKLTNISTQRELSQQSKISDYSYYYNQPTVDYMAM